MTVARAGRWTTASAIAVVLLAACGDQTGSKPVPAATSAPPRTVTPREDPGIGERMPLQAGVHISTGQKGQWSSDPPTSGQHWPIYAQWGPAAQDYAPELWVHNLEHGGVAILYRDLGDQGAADDFIRRAPRESRFNEVKLVDARYPALGHRFGLVAWGWRLFLDAWGEEAAVRFYAGHVDQGPESIP